MYPGLSMACHLFIKDGGMWHLWFCLNIQRAVSDLSGKNHLTTKQNECVPWVVVSEREYFWSQFLGKERKK